MIIQFKEAPELGRLRVVSDPGGLNECRLCRLLKSKLGSCYSAAKAGFNCVENDIYFEQVTPVFRIERLIQKGGA